MSGEPIASRRLRELILEESHRAHVGHIGSCLSIVEIIAALFGGVLRRLSPEDPERDRFVLSKGHAVLTVYAALHLQGALTREELATYCTDGSLLGSHPDHRLRGSDGSASIDFSTGSLGMGLSMCAGTALAAKMTGSPARSFVLLSDAEMNEGSVWETVMFAAHHRLDHLRAVVDCNRQQAMGATRDIIDLDPLAAKWSAFGWTVREVDGHDLDALRAALDAPPLESRPTVVIAHTVFGRGVSYMEGHLRWHYFPMDDAQYAQARHDVATS